MPTFQSLVASTLSQKERYMLSFAEPLITLHYVQNAMTSLLEHLAQTEWMWRFEGYRLKSGSRGPSLKASPAGILRLQVKNQSCLPSKWKTYGPECSYRLFSYLIRWKKSSGYWLELRGVIEWKIHRWNWVGFLTWVIDYSRKAGGLGKAERGVWGSRSSLC